MHRTAFAGLCACMSTFLLMRRQALQLLGMRWQCASTRACQAHACKHAQPALHGCVYVSWLNSLKCGSDDPPRLAFGAATNLAPTCASGQHYW